MEKDRNGQKSCTPINQVWILCNKEDIAFNEAYQRTKLQKIKKEEISENKLVDLGNVSRRKRTLSKESKSNRFYNDMNDERIERRLVENKKKTEAVFTKK